MSTGQLKVGFKALLARANAEIESLSVQDLAYVEDDPDAVIVDVRDAAERKADGAIPGSVHASRGLLEFHADPESPVHIDALKPDRKIVLYCGTGGRSALAAKTLQDMGFTDVLSLAGGFAAWRVANSDN
ncbi:MAG: rhodanese-like domain-containing protein [Hyphomicrobiaceae bacterium]